MEDISTFGILVSQCRTLKALRGSWGTFWALLKPFHQLSSDQAFVLFSGWLQLFLWACCQSSDSAFSWALQSSCDYVNENVGPWGVRSTQRLIRAPLAAAGMSRKVHCILAPEIWTGLPLPRRKSQLQSVLSWRPSGSLAVEMQMWWDSFVTKSLECRAEEVGYIPMHLA